LKNLLKFFYTFIFLLKLKPLKLINFYTNNFFLKKTSKILLLNFKRNRFFPSIKNTTNTTYVTLSLGLFSSFFQKGKFFIKNKSVYLVLAGFLRKILLYANINNLILFIKHTPIYLQELISSINNPVINFYKNPFTLENVNESFLKNKFYFNMFIFMKNKSYTFLKQKKKGRVKRKISKRVVSINRLVD